MKIHFCISCKTEKAPPKRSLKFFQQKRKWVRDLSWNAFGPSTGSGTLFIRFCSWLYTMISQVLLLLKASVADKLACPLPSRRAATPQV